MEDNNDTQNVNTVQNFKVSVTKVGKPTVIYSGFECSRPVLSNVFDTTDHLVNFPPAGGPQSRRAMASAQSASL